MSTHDNDQRIWAERVFVNTAPIVSNPTIKWSDLRNHLTREDLEKAIKEEGLEGQVKIRKDGIGPGYTLELLDKDNIPKEFLDRVLKETPATGGIRIRKFNVLDRAKIRTRQFEQEKEDERISKRIFDQKTDGGSGTKA